MKTNPNVNAPSYFHTEEYLLWKKKHDRQVALYGDWYDFTELFESVLGVGSENLVEFLALLNMSGLIRYYSDNGDRKRMAIANNSLQWHYYHNIKDSGCCGSIDEVFMLRDGTNVLFGFNYGH